MKPKTSHKHTSSIPSSRVAGWADDEQLPTKGLFADRARPAPKEVDDKAIRSVLLFTDGDANEGITSTSELVRKLEEELGVGRNVRVFTFGFGADHSPELLGEVARVGAGTYYYIEREDMIPGAFGHVLGGLLSVAAQNVALEFVPAPGVAVSSVHSTFPTTRGVNGAPTVSVGDMLSEEAKDLVMEVELGASKQEQASCPVGTLAVRYLDVSGQTLRRTEVASAVKRLKNVAGVEAHPEVVMHKARIATAAALAEAKDAAEEGKLEAGRACLSQARVTVGKLPEASPLKVQLARDLEEAMMTMEDAGTYAERGSKVMTAKSAAHWNQRSCGLEEEEEEDEGGLVGQLEQRLRGLTDTRGKAAGFSYATKSQRMMKSRASQALSSC